MGGRSGCSQWERGAGQHHELLQEWWGSNFPTPLSQEIHTLRKNRCQHWGLKPGMDVATRDLCPSLGWGDMAWTQLSLCGAWVSIHLSMHTFHSLRTPPGFLVAEAVPVSPLSVSGRLVGSAQPGSILTVHLPLRVWSQLLHQYLLLFPPQSWLFWTACF